MFFRGRNPEASVRGRFNRGSDGFTFLKEGDHYAAHVVTNAEQVVDLFHTLTEHLPPAVDVAIEDIRTRREWKGEHLALPDVREAIARLKVPLAGNGGVEISVYTPEDQLTLNGYLELFIYSRTDRWLYILEGKGLEEVKRVRTRSWKFKAEDYPPAPDLSDAVSAAAQRLALAGA